MVDDLKKAENATIKSSFIILLLSVLKTITGYFFNSLVLLTDGIHSFTDLVTNFASFIGLRIAQREPDEEFPYGYYKAESIVSLLISLFILYLGYEFFMQGLNVLSTTSEVSNVIITSLSAGVSIIISYLLSNYLISVGVESNSQSLITNGKEKRVDVLTTSMVFFAIILSFYQIRYVEGIVTIIISLFIFKEGFESVKDSIFALMDVSASREKEGKILRIISEIPGVEGYEGLKLRKAGPIIFGEITLMLRKRLDVERVKSLCNQVERRAESEIKELKELTVSLDVYEPPEKRVILPVKSVDEENPWLSNEFGKSNHFIYLTLKKGEVVKKEYLKNRYKKLKKKIGLRVANFLSEKGVDEVIVRNVGEIAFNTFESNIVTVYETSRRKYKTALEDYKNGEIQELKESNN